MIDMHISPINPPINFSVARQLAMDAAKTGNLRTPAVISWHQHSLHRFSPSFEGGDEATWWHKYGTGNNGQVAVRVGDDFEFVMMESDGFESVGVTPIRNLDDEFGNHYICLASLLDDTNKPRRDACTPLDEWMADQY